MYKPEIAKVATELFEWCRKSNFAGHDPFDGLNSRLFQATPLKHIPMARLLWTQLLKRSPINLRHITLVPTQRNPKGIALFALAALANYRRAPTQETAAQAQELLADLLNLRFHGWSGSAWGYNFDWQSRAFYAPQGTPAIVPTAFAARAFIEGARAFQEHKYLDTARSTCDFILKDLLLIRNIGEEEICFSYVPNSETQIYNASLLAAETLARVGSLTNEKELLEKALSAARYVVKQQRNDGSWLYGATANQNWVDSFHTAYILSSLATIIKHSDQANNEFENSLKRAIDFWRARFFLADGWPKYYHDRLYPVDTHAAAAAIVTLLDLRQFTGDAVKQAVTIARWSIQNLRDKSGFFYYQRRRFTTVRTPFMRWTQAWMLYALRRLQEEQGLAG